MGARPETILGMLVLEVVLVAALGALLGMALLYVGLLIGQPILDGAYGLWLPIEPPSLRGGWTVAGVVDAGALVSLVPAIRASLRARAGGASSLRARPFFRTGGIAGPLRATMAPWQRRAWQAPPRSRC